MSWIGGGYKQQIAGRSRQCGSSQQIPKQSRTLMGLLRRPLHHNRAAGAGDSDADGATLTRD